MSDVPPQRHPTKTVVAGVIGNVLEWYDFAVFGFLAPFIGPLFFPSESQLAELLNTFGVFALGFLMRPVGGVIFGHIGLGQIKRTGEEGRGQAIAGLIIGYGTIALGLIMAIVMIGILGIGFLGMMSSY